MICCQRLDEHNSGNGAKFTQSNFPYAIVAYICGFDNNKHLRLYVEKQWKNRIQNLKNNGNHSVTAWVDQGIRVIRAINKDKAFENVHNQLRFIRQCSEI